MERLCFPRVTFTHVPVLRVRILNERGGGRSPLLKSATHEGRRLPLRSTKKPTKPLFCVSEKSFEAVEGPFVQTHTLNACLFTRPSFREIFSLHYAKRTPHAHTMCLRGYTGGRHRCAFFPRQQSEYCTPGHQKQQEVNL